MHAGVQGPHVTLPTGGSNTLLSHGPVSCGFTLGHRFPPHQVPPATSASGPAGACGGALSLPHLWEGGLGFPPPPDSLLRVGVCTVGALSCCTPAGPTPCSKPDQSAQASPLCCCVAGCRDEVIFIQRLRQELCIQEPSPKSSGPSCLLGMFGAGAATAPFCPNAQHSLLMAPL